MSVLASLFMAGCSQEEIVSNDDGNGGSNTSYMAVNLLSSDLTGTRAASGYQDGEPEENKVQKVRFYFFTANGAAANVKLSNGSFVNYFDWTPGEKDQSNGTIDDDDIESKLAVTIVINTAEGDRGDLQRMAAVLNPPTDMPDGSKSLQDLQKIMGDYAASGYTTEGTFVMFNAVYGDNGVRVRSAVVKPENLAASEEKAKEKPVTIYVERSVAKVRVLLGKDVEAAATGRIPLKDKKGDDLIVKGKQIYLSLGGWGLTAETDKGNLIKDINPAWTSNWWNGTHRSFWAINAKDAKNQYHTYNDIKKGFGTANSLYTNENALDFTENSQTQELERTKVILKGTLCDDQGTPYTLFRHMGAHYIDSYNAVETKNLVKLKEALLAELGQSVQYYYETTAEGQTKRVQIGTDDVKVVIATQKEEENSQNNCYVHLELIDAAKGKTWYNSLAADATPLTNAAATINKSLVDNVTPALVWKEGQTYYFYEIIHDKTDTNPTKGVVRNHIYQTTVTKIAGLGTPVYDPKQDVYPEIPDPNYHYVAAQINILSWRIVNNNYELEW